MYLCACELWSKFPWCSREIYSLEITSGSRHHVSYIFLQIVLQLPVPKFKRVLYVPNHICITLLLSLSSTGALGPTGHLQNWGPMCWDTKALVDVTQSRHLNWSASAGCPWAAPLPCRFCFHSQVTDPAEPGSTPESQPWVTCSAMCAMPCVLLSKPAVVLETVCSREWDGFPPSCAVFQHYPNGLCVAQRWILPLCFIVLEINILSVKLQ